MLQGHEIIIADNFFTGRKLNVEHWIGHANFELIHHDIVNPLYIEVDEIYHLASPASPPHYMFNPVKTIKTNTVGEYILIGTFQAFVYLQPIQDNKITNRGSLRHAFCYQFSSALQDKNDKSKKFSIFVVPFHCMRLQKVKIYVTDSVCARTQWELREL